MQRCVRSRADVVEALDDTECRPKVHREDEREKGDEEVVSSTHSDQWGKQTLERSPRLAQRETARSERN